MSRARQRALGQYFTPPALVDHVLDLAKPEALPPSATVLEPSCGDGAFLVGLISRLGPRAADLEVHAFEVDPKAAAAARKRVSDALVTDAGVRPARALALAGRWVREADFLATELSAPVDLTLGNPPFLEAKRMPSEDKRRLRAAWPRWTKGAFDLYVPFVGRAAGLLTSGGRLAFVLPNKVAIAAYARELRRLLLEELQLTAMTDLWDTRAFDGAAVYPVVLAARSRDEADEVPATWHGPPDPASSATRLAHPEPSSSPNQVPPPSQGQGGRARVTTYRGRREGDGSLTFAKTGELPDRVLMDAPDQVLFTFPEAAHHRRELEVLLTPTARLHQYLDIRWAVSFHKAGVRDRYLFPERPASPHARPLLGAGRYQGNADVDRYRLSWRGWWIDYDRERARGEGNHLPDPTIFEGPKLVICQNAKRLRAAYDDEDHVLKDTFFSARPTTLALQEKIPLKALLGVLNSDLLHRYYLTVFGMTRVNGGYLHYLGAYLKHLPMPSAKMLDERLVAAVEACELAATRGGESALAAPAAEVERLVRDAYGV